MWPPQRKCGHRHGPSLTGAAQKDVSPCEHAGMTRQCGSTLLWRPPPAYRGPPSASKLEVGCCHPPAPGRSAAQLGQLVCHVVLVQLLLLQRLLRVQRCLWQRYLAAAGTGPLCSCSWSGGCSSLHAGCCRCCCCVPSLVLSGRLCQQPSLVIPGHLAVNRWRASLFDLLEHLRRHRVPVRGRRVVDRFHALVQGS